MCNFFSAVLTKDQVFYSHESVAPGECDSHEAIIRGANQKKQTLNADGARGVNVLRTELTPSAKTTRLEDFASYEFVIDQDVYPSWYDKANAEERTREAIKERFKGQKVNRVGTLVLPKGSKVSSNFLTSVGGSLYVSADAELPALTSVGGYLDVRADAELPALTSVGGYLYVSAGKTLKAPSLAKVNGKRYPSKGRA